jgi:hypothetical protein
VWLTQRSADWSDDADTMAPKTPPDEEPPIEVSPEAHAAMAELVKIFSDPKLQSTASFRCHTEGPNEFDVMFESIMEEQFGYDPNTEYKRWIRRLYEIGLIPRLPDE